MGQRIFFFYLSIQRTLGHSIFRDRYLPFFLISSKNYAKSFMNDDNLQLGILQREKELLFKYLKEKYWSSKHLLTSQ